MIPFEPQLMAHRQLPADHLPKLPIQRTLHRLALSALLYAPSQISGKVGIPCTTIWALGKPGCHPSLSAQTPPQPFSAQAASVDWGFSRRTENLLSFFPEKPGVGLGAQGLSSQPASFHVQM